MYNFLKLRATSVTVVFFQTLVVYRQSPMPIFTPSIKSACWERVGLYLLYLDGWRYDPDLVTYA